LAVLGRALYTHVEVRIYNYFHIKTQLDGLGKGKLTLPLDGGVEVEEEVVGGGLVVDEPPSDTVMEEDPLL
jgi:hypothetical protein